MKESLSRVIYFLKGLVNAMSSEEIEPYPEAHGKNPPDILDINRAIEYLEDSEDEQEHINLDELGME